MGTAVNIGGSNQVVTNPAGERSLDSARRFVR